MGTVPGGYKALFKIKSYSVTKNYIHDDRAQDYHDMSSQIFYKTKGIRANGGIHTTLDFGNDMKHDVIAIPVIQFIIGDCKIK